MFVKVFLNSGLVSFVFRVLLPRDGLCSLREGGGGPVCCFRRKNWIIIIYVQFIRLSLYFTKYECVVFFETVQKLPFLVFSYYFLNIQCRRQFLEEIFRWSLQFVVVSG